MQKIILEVNQIHGEVLPPLHILSLVFDNISAIIAKIVHIFTV